MNGLNDMRTEGKHPAHYINEEPHLFDLENNEGVQTKEDMVPSKIGNREMCQRLYIKEEKISSDEESNVEDNANKHSNDADLQEMNKAKDNSHNEMRTEEKEGPFIKEEPYLYDLENSERVQIKESIVLSKEGNREICQRFYIKEEELSSDESNVENNINKHDVGDSQQMNGCGSTELGMNTLLPIEVFMKEENNIGIDYQNPDVTAPEISYRIMKVDDKLEKHFLCSKMAGDVQKKNQQQRKCSFIGCEKSRNEYPNLHLFRFPIENPTICKEWVLNSKNESLINLPIKKLYRKVVCEDHFTEDCFYSTMRTNLKKNVVPTLVTSSDIECPTVQMEQPSSSSEVPTYSAIDVCDSPFMETSSSIIENLPQQICSFIGCSKSSSDFPTLHTFNIPINNPNICKEWTVNYKNNSLVNLLTKQLQEKVVCGDRCSKMAEDVPKKKYQQKKCSFIGCKKSRNEYPNLHLFRFPIKNPTICKEWIINSKNESLINLPIKTLNGKVVCEDHFTEDCFLSTMRTSLKKNIVPTLVTSSDIECPTVQMEQPSSSSEVPTYSAIDVCDSPFMETSSSMVKNLPQQKCSFIGCSKSSSEFPTLHTFHFPINNPNICKEWVVNCKNNSLINLSVKELQEKVVCGDHFTSQCFLGKKKYKLKKNAVPTLTSISGIGYPTVQMEHSYSSREVPGRSLNSDTDLSLNGTSSRNTTKFPRKKYLQEKCSFIGCAKSKNEFTKLHLFHFPIKRPTICKEWVVNCKNDSLVNLPIFQLYGKLVCEDHFTEDCFFSKKKNKLKENAVPTLTSSSGIGCPTVQIEHPYSSREVPGQSLNSNFDSPLNVTSSRKSKKLPRKTYLQKKCSFIGCSKSRNVFPNLHLFRFPVKRPTICEEWVVNCKNDSLVNLPINQLYGKLVCEDHFTEDCFCSTRKNSLKKNAVPRLTSSSDVEHQTLKMDELSCSGEVPAHTVNDDSPLNETPLHNRNSENSAICKKIASNF